ncbi:MFS transporter [Longispora albida]|uniref:MFS transporter n=1 Tax=Longispora albida TaxID=203523 RepID=UPI000476A0F5|nr:MFS transporter [Longispora albida]
MNQPFPGTAQHAPQPVPRPGWLLIGPVIAAAVGAFLLTVTIGEGWTAISRDLALPNTSVIWNFAVYLVPAVLAAVIGALAGSRWPTAVAMPAAALLVPGCLLTSLASDSTVLLIGRGVTGFAAGLAWGVTAALVAKTGPGRMVAGLTAGCVILLSLVAGPVSWLVLGSVTTWRVPFLLAAVPALLAVLASLVSGIILLVQRSNRPPQPQPPAFPPHAHM